MKGSTRSAAARMTAVILKLTTSTGMTVVARTGGPGAVVLTLEAEAINLNAYLSPTEAESVAQTLLQCVREARKLP